MGRVLLGLCLCTSHFGIWGGGLFMSPDHSFLLFPFLPERVKTYASALDDEHQDVEKRSAYVGY